MMCNVDVDNWKSDPQNSRPSTWCDFSTHLLFALFSLISQLSQVSRDQKRAGRGKLSFKMLGFKMQVVKKMGKIMALCLLASCSKSARVIDPG
jgi:hypothetical protein